MTEPGRIRRGGAGTRRTAAIAVFLAMAAAAHAAPVMTECEPTTRTVPLAEVYARPTAYETRPWGTAAFMALPSAPFPDDSRTTGFTRRGATMPYAGHYDDPTVAVLLPRRFRPSARVDVVLHFHGHGTSARKAVADFALGEALDASGRDAIMIVPQGPKDAGDSGAGKLERPGGFAAMVADALARLAADGRLPAGAAPGTVILGGHSGGYRPVGKVLAAGDLAANIKEIWLWDAAYGLWEDYATFAEGGQPRRVRSIFTDHLRTENIRIMSLMSLAGQPFALVYEDDITTDAPALSQSGASILRPDPDGGPAAKPSLDALLRRHPNLFVHTRLSHYDVVARNRYLERFLRESPNLRPVPPAGR